MCIPEKTIYSAFAILTDVFLNQGQKRLDPRWLEYLLKQGFAICCFIFKTS